MNAISFGALCFSSLFTVIDPIAVAPVFASMTAGFDAPARRRTVLRACLAALSVLIVFAVGGTFLLKLFGVTIEAFRIAGGILFTLLGLSMLRAAGAEGQSAEATGDPSIVPLGIPLIGGPGAMTTVMVLMGQSQSSTQVAMLAVALLSVLLLTAGLLAAAPAILARLGPTGIELTTKVMGLIVLVIGVQFVIDGVSPVVRAMLAG
jgi:multiple antibiotic resistance protein